MTHAIVLIHGMGKYGTVKDNRYIPDTDGWHSRAAAFLNIQYDTFVRGAFGYPEGSDRPYIIIPINYDSTFEKFRTAWAAQAESWTPLKASLDSIDLVGGSGISDLVGQLQSLFSGTGNADKFVWTHLADVALYLAPIVRAQVEADIWVQFGKAMSKAIRSDGVTGWSLLGHSLGTLVTLDLLNKVVNDEFRDRYPGIPTPRCVTLLANVSQFLTRGVPDIYSTRIRPGFARGPKSLLSFSHSFDVLAQLEPFRAPWGRGYIEDNGLSDIFPGDTVNATSFRSADWGQAVLSLGGLPHEFSHYMKQPKVCAAFWTRVLAKELRETRLQTAAAEAYSGELRTAVRNRIETKARAFLNDWTGTAYFENGLTLRALRQAILRGLT